MSHIPSNFSKWPSWAQRIWMARNPGVTVRDHRTNHRVPSHRGGDRVEHVHAERVHTRDRGGRTSDSQFQQMLDSGNIEQLLNSPGAGEWLKKPENNLKVMMAIQNENRLFTLLSNVVKVKHDTAKAFINNVRA